MCVCGQTSQPTLKKLPRRRNRDDRSGGTSRARRSRSLPTDVPPSSPLISVAAAFRQNGAGRINQTTPSVLRDSPPSGRVHCSIRNNINNILVVGTWSMSHASPSTVFRRPDLDIIRSSGDRLRNAHAQAGGKRLRQGSIGAEKRSDIIGGCRMSGSSKNERRRRHNNVVRG